MLSTDGVESPTETRLCCGAAHPRWGPEEAAALTTGAESIVSVAAASKQRLNELLAEAACSAQRTELRCSLQKLLDISA